MRILLPVLAGTIAIVAVVLSAIALADDENGDGADGGASLTEIQDQLDEILEQHEQIHTSLMTAQMVAALDALDGAGIHEFDEQTTQAASMDDLPVGYAAAVRKVHTVVTSVDWPEDVAEEVQAIVAGAERLEPALDGEDLTEIKAASPVFHLAWHDLREVGWAALSGQGPTMEEQHGHSDGMETQ